MNKSTQKERGSEERGATLASIFMAILMAITTILVLSFTERHEDSYEAAECTNGDNVYPARALVDNISPGWLAGKYRTEVRSYHLVKDSILTEASAPGMRGGEISGYQCRILDPKIAAEAEEAAQRRLKDLKTGFFR